MKQCMLVFKLKGNLKSCRKIISVLDGALDTVHIHLVGITLWLLHLYMCVFRFLSMLEEEIYGENSPIWEADFTMPASDGTQLGHQTGEAVIKLYS